MISVSRGTGNRRRRRGRQAERADGAAPWRLTRPRHLREQFERAGRFQRSLLPDVSTPIGDFRLSSVYMPCETVSGDFYDLVVAPGRGLLIVADVMGHGVGAALITMLVKAAFQEAASAGDDPGELLAAMNHRLHGSLPTGLFVAASVVRIDADEGALGVANAGLPHPYLLRAADGRVEEIGVDGLPLGLFDGLAAEAWEAGAVRLAPGDVLLLASDGVGSVESPAGQCFGERRFRDALVGLVGRDGQEVLDRLISEAMAFGGGRPQPDDIDLIAISRPLSLPTPA